MENLIYKQQSYEVIGKCFEVHNYLGPGFLEVVYKDALELEFQRNGIPFIREREYRIDYKGTILKHTFSADFLVYDSIILEIKAVSKLTELSVAQSINYLKASGKKLALLINFGETKLNCKRLVF